MNKKLLLTVLAAGLVFPTATASANEPLRQQKAELKLVTMPDGSKQWAQVQNIGGDLRVQENAVDHNGNENPALKGLSLKQDEKSAISTDVPNNPGAVGINGKGLAQEAKPEVTSIKGSVLTQEAKPTVDEKAFAAQVAKEKVKKSPVKVSAKKGTKALPKTSAVK